MIILINNVAFILLNVLRLYPILRIDYIRDYATSSVPVPVIIDDILVNFDPARRKNACDAIADLAETCQVLYFTCHPETVRDLTEAVPGAVVMGLGGEVVETQK